MNKFNKFIFVLFRPGFMSYLIIFFYSSYWRDDGWWYRSDIDLRGALEILGGINLVLLNLHFYRSIFFFCRCVWIMFLVLWWNWRAAHVIELNFTFCSSTFDTTDATNWVYWIYIGECRVKPNISVLQFDFAMFFFFIYVCNMYIKYVAICGFYTNTQWFLSTLCNNFIFFYIKKKIHFKNSILFTLISNYLQIFNDKYSVIK